MKPLRVGCSGWSYESWRGRFYPEKLSPSRWLEAYAESLDTVEVKTTFHRLQKRAAVELAEIGLDDAYRRPALRRQRDGRRPDARWTFWLL